MGSENWKPNLKTKPFEIRTFLSRRQIVFGNMVLICPDFRSHSKSRTFAIQPLCDPSKSRLVRISDPHCTNKLVWDNYKIYIQSSIHNPLLWWIQSGCTCRVKCINRASTKIRVTEILYKKLNGFPKNKPSNSQHLTANYSNVCHFNDSPLFECWSSKTTIWIMDDFVFAIQW